jgi:CRP-like cAMP-binding protein
MSEKLNDLYRKAENDLLEKKYEAALAGFATVVKADPNHLWSRFQVARVLEGLKQNNRAFEIYKALAWHCLKAGYPLLGLGATKRAGRIQKGFDDTLQETSELYGLESDRVDQELVLPADPDLRGDLVPAQVIQVDDRLPAAAEQLAKTFPENRYNRALPPLPLFSFLSKEAFFPILEILVLKTFQPGQTIVKEGDPGTSIYLLAHGEVEVVEGRDKKSHTLARLTSGAVFGEMALITDAPRVASAVALRETDVLELNLEEVTSLAEDVDDTDITWAVAKFTRQRFLTNLMKTSPIFTHFPAERRKEILERFTSIGVPTDEVLIREGEPGPGLYIILGGEAEISKFQGGSRVHVTNLKEGSILGEISLLRDTPTTATVTAIRGGEFLFLSREDFEDLVQAHPEIREALEQLSEERLQEQQQAIKAAGILSEDGALIF